MNHVKVSVIIPCYNSSATVCETLESLERQTVRPFEVICINDGSTDDTEGILTDYIASSPLRIELLSQKNAGVSVARNAGIEKASGDVLLFLDADDKYAVQFVEQIALAFFGGYDTAMGYFTYEETALAKEITAENCSSKSRDEIMDEFMYCKNKCHTSAISYKRSILMQHSIRFTPGAKYGEDWEFTTKYLDRCTNGLVIAAPVMFYRQSDTSVMRRVTYDRADVIAAAERVETFLYTGKSDYYDRFCVYMKHRAVFSVAHVFAQKRKKELYRKLLKEQDVGQSMKMLCKNARVGGKVRMAAASFLMSPWLFYYISGRK